MARFCSSSSFSGTTRVSSIQPRIQLAFRRNSLLEHFFAAILQPFLEQQLAASFAVSSEFRARCQAADFSP